MFESLKKQDGLSIMHARILKSIEELTKERGEINKILPEKKAALQDLLVLKELGDPFDHEQLIILQREVEVSERRLSQIALTLPGLEARKAQEEEAYKLHQVKKLQDKLLAVDLRLLHNLRDKLKHLIVNKDIEDKLTLEYNSRNEVTAELGAMKQDAPIFCAPDDWFKNNLHRSAQGISPWDLASGKEGLDYLDRWIAKLEAELK